MSSVSNKSWIMALVGIGAFIGAAVIYHIYSSRDEAATNDSTDDCIKEIDALGSPVKGPNGLLEFGYYKNVFSIIAKYAKKKYGEDKKKSLKLRREHYKN